MPSLRASAAAFALIAMVLAAAGFVSPHPAFSQSGSTLTGWMWAGDTVGWISASCTNTSVCGSSNYGFTVDAVGVIAGYGWSENIGWVSANPSDLAGCPTAPCEARISSATLTGWLKAISGGGAQSGGWDGWIRINGANWGPILQNDGYFSGFLWGSDVVGWASAALLHTNYEPCQAAYSCSGQTIVYLSAQCRTSEVTTCVEPAFCAAGSAVCLVPSPRFDVGLNGLTGHLQARPTIVRPGGVTRLYWNVSNVANCTVTGTNGDRWNATVSGASGTTTSPIGGSTTFSMHCNAYEGASPPSINESVTVSIAPTWREI